MKFFRFVLPLLCLTLLVLGYRWWGWMGGLAVLGGLVMWLLLHFHRTLTVLRRAATRPMGHADSAVMLNAKLQKGMTLLHVVALTRALGVQKSPKDVQPELFCWTDASRSTVTAEFLGGKLHAWTLTRETLEESALPEPQPARVPE